MSTPLPVGYHSVNPYIVVDDARALIDFLKEVFRAIEPRRPATEGRRIQHAEVVIGDSLVMISEADDKYPARPCVHFVYVEDVDSTYGRAVAMSARPILAPTDQAWGDRVGGFHDPFDNRWWIATHLRPFPGPLGATRDCGA